ncbi:hypothetical protein [Luteimonas terrae]|uniref:Uncharacterized protein n=1 Tax=Luteimonas terrae TaxID=1530191 RepID=A0ABU1XVD3_9GAMM|nr:hypothetical protein [Luteimonas terrae]MDR7192717.1 hypothetical protein [Luteimonas terrae]
MDAILTLSGGDAAAWTQAILSGAGIILAAFMPLYMRWSQRHFDTSKIVAALDLATHHAERAVDLRSVLEQDRNNHDETLIWRGISSALENLSPSALPTPKLLQHLVIARAVAERQVSTIRNIAERGLGDHAYSALVAAQMTLRDIAADARAGK